MSAGLLLTDAVASTRRGAPYGPLKPADANGVMLPRGFASRVVARAGQLVPHTSYRWPRYPDGSATFPTRDGGWILACNSEDDRPGRGGVSAIRFSHAGRVRSAYRVLEHTVDNCSGG